MNAESDDALMLAVRDGEPVLERYAGVESIESRTPIGPETRFYVASVGKTFTAVAVLLLYEQGRLRLEDPLSRHVDGLPR